MGFFRSIARAGSRPTSGSDDKTEAQTTSSGIAPARPTRGVEAHVDLALQARKRRDIVEEEGHWRRAFESDRKALKPAIGWSSARQQLGDTDGLDEMLCDLAARMPRSPAPHRELGKLFKNSDAPRALDHWVEAYRLDPKHEPTGQVAAQLALELQRSDLAHAVAKGLLRLDKHSTKTLVIAEKILLEMGEIDEAWRLGTLRMKRDPNAMRLSMSEDYCALAMQARKQKQSAMEESNWWRAYQLNPTGLRAAIGWANSRRISGNHRGLEKFILEIRDRFPEKAAAYRELGKFYNYQAADPQRSLENWSLAVEKDPSHEPTALLATRLAVELGELGRARGFVARMLEAPNPSTQVLVLAGEISAGSGRFAEAGEIALSRLRRDPEEPGIVAAVGNATLRLVQRGLLELDARGKRLATTAPQRSQFLEDPAQCMAAWKASGLYRVRQDAMHDAAASKSEAVKTRTRRAKNILFVTDANWNFMQGIVETFAASDEVNVRTLEFNDSTAARLGAGMLAGTTTADGMKAPQMSRQATASGLHKDLIEWADTIFVDWCNYPAVWLSHYAPQNKKLVVRLHSYEAFTFWPYLVNWGNVDILVTVADHIRNFLFESVDPTEFGTTRSVNVVNYNDLDSYSAPKLPDARKTLGLIGYANANKDPVEALKILKALREKDPSWRLLLVGHPWPDELDAEDDSLHRAEFDRVIESSGLHEAVQYQPYTSNLRDVFAKVGYVLSTSRREGTHESVLQAMSTGSVPVVRKWPTVRRWVTDSWIYDEQWLYEAPEHAAATILRIEAEGAYGAKSEAAKREAFSKFDASVMIPQLTEVLLARD